MLGYYEMRIMYRTSFFLACFWELIDNFKNHGFKVNEGQESKRFKKNYEDNCFLFE